jgi:hypothetical protein
MAVYDHDEQRSYDVGHGTRMGFRIVSILGAIGLVAFLVYFIYGSPMAVSENPPAGQTNTPVESMAAPPQQETPAAVPAQSNPAQPQAQPAPQSESPPAPAQP